jgi:exodeoxyribonuclease V beta subunit
MMNGFIDLFFEYKGKYYILDWKSNHLGSELTAYDNEGTSQAMKDNNYHLQYLIYTVALKRFLKNRITDFDYKQHFGGVFYLFLRGVRAKETSGVFYSLPDEELINKIDEVLS